MRSKIISSVVLLMLCTTMSWAADGSGTSGNALKQLESRAAEVKGGKVSEYATDAVKEALTGVTAAQSAAAGGNPKLTQQRIETANLLLSVAEAKGTERELLEKVAIQRVELKKLEAQLEKNLHVEVKP
jgi:hypothetical protein